MRKVLISRSEAESLVSVIAANETIIPPHDKVDCIEFTDNLRVVFGMMSREDENKEKETNKEA